MSVQLDTLQNKFMKDCTNSRCAENEDHKYGNTTFYPVVKARLDQAAADIINKYLHRSSGYIPKATLYELDKDYNLEGGDFHGSYDGENDVKSVIRMIYLALIHNRSDVLSGITNILQNYNQSPEGNELESPEHRAAAYAEVYRTYLNAVIALPQISVE